MKLVNLLLAYLTLPTISVNAIQDKSIRRLKKDSKERSKSSDETSETGTACNRTVWSVVNPNDEWEGHPFHRQVWYHTLDEINSLWKNDYFEYVLDVRPLEDSSMTTADGGSLLLEGWETFHIPGSYPLGVPGSTPADEVDMIVDFASSDVCKDARIFVHCWSGKSANMVVKTLVELGFTNVHAAGPQGTAGIWDWKKAGHELVYDDEFNPKDVPKCMKKCM